MRSDDPCVDRCSSRHGARRDRPRSPRRRAAGGEVGERRRGECLELGRADRLGVRPDPLDRALEAVRVGVEALVPAARRAARCRRRPADRAGDAARARSTCPSCRPRGPRRTTAAGRRAGEQLHASAPSRSRPPATGESDSSHRSQSTADCIELAPVALELVALFGDDIGRGVRDEALVREHLLGARDLAAQPLALRVDVAVPPCGARSGFTTASKIRSSSPSSCGTTPERRNTCAYSCTRSSAPASDSSPASGHGATISRVSRDGRCDQISSVTCGIAGWSSFSSHSSANIAVARASASPS